SLRGADALTGLESEMGSSRRILPGVRALFFRSRRLRLPGEDVVTLSGTYGAALGDHPPRAAIPQSVRGPDRRARSGRFPLVQPRPCARALDPGRVLCEQQLQEFPLRALLRSHSCPVVAR